MFYLHGRKGRAASTYPAPEYPLVIEPFAGSMGYSLHHRPPNAIGVERDRQTFEHVAPAVRDDGRRDRRLPRSGRRHPRHRPVGAGGGAGW